jgi:hypothetical protein
MPENIIPMDLKLNIENGAIEDSHLEKGGEKG